MVDIPQISCEDWNRIAKANAIENFIRVYGRAPESEEEAVRWQRRRVAEIERAELKKRENFRSVTLFGMKGSPILAAPH